MILPILQRCLAQAARLLIYKIQLTVTGQQAYALFHSKLQDYLREDEEYPHLHVFAKDEEEHHHALLAQRCEQGGLVHIWEETRDSREQFRRIYARRHYVTHLYQAQLDQQLFSVLDKGEYGRAKERLDRTTRSYMQDLDLGRRAAMRPYMESKTAISFLPELWRYTLLRCSIRSQADQYPTSLFDALLLVHRESEVLGLAELLTDEKAKIDVLLRLGLHFASHTNKQHESTQAFIKAQNIARLIEDVRSRTETLGKLVQALGLAQQWE